MKLYFKKLFVKLNNNHDSVHYNNDDDDKDDGENVGHAYAEEK